MPDDDALRRIEEEQRNAREERAALRARCESIESRIVSHVPRDDIRAMIVSIIARTFRALGINISRTISDETQDKDELAKKRFELLDPHLGPIRNDAIDEYIATAPQRKLRDTWVDEKLAAEEKKRTRETRTVSMTVMWATVGGTVVAVLTLWFAVIYPLLLHKGH